MQGDSGNDKMDESTSSFFENDKKIEVILKECEALRNEANLHLEAQYQLTNVALLLLGGVVTVVALLFGLNGQGLHLTISQLYLVILLLVVSPLFTSFFHATMSHQHDLGLIGVYINHDSRALLCELLGVERDSNFFSWDVFHQQQLTSGSMSKRVASAIFAASHIGVVGVLALLNLLAAIWFYAVDFSLLSAGAARWVALIVLMFDVLYYLLGLPAIMEALNTFQQIQ